MKRATLFVLVAGVAFLGSHGTVLSHCEIPCGIYGDTTRIDLLYEDIQTVEKSMVQIAALSSEKEMNVNQVVRWVRNKEEHANKIQHVVTQYFMTQRVKPKGADSADHAKYVKQITTLHAMLIAAMKAKQTTDVEHCKQLRELVGQFSEAYFSAADLEHIRSHHKNG